MVLNTSQFRIRDEYFTYGNTFISNNKFVIDKIQPVHNQKKTNLYIEIQGKKYLVEITGYRNDAMIFLDTTMTAQELFDTIPRSGGAKILNNLPDLLLGASVIGTGIYLYNSK